MNRLTFIIIATSALLGSSLLAGPPEYKQVVPPPTPVIYGTGFYGAIDMGANVFQNRGGTKVFSNEFGDTLTIDPKNDVGFFGGLKAGYVFGTGVFRPTVEGDFFYNGFRGGADATVRFSDGDIFRHSSATTFINTGAFMGNFIARFSFGRFQPYVGAGVGIYYAESAGLDFTGPNGSFNTSGGASHADLAWQILAGTDYYWNRKFSTFIEYRYLNYTSTQIDTNEGRDLGQHLIGAGLRFHF
jgi:opacity protein-like surface antigen